MSQIYLFYWLVLLLFKLWLYFKEWCLCTPQISRNLISVPQFTKGNSLSSNFTLLFHCEGSPHSLGATSGPLKHGSTIRSLASVVLLRHVPFSPSLPPVPWGINVWDILFFPLLRKLCLFSSVPKITIMNFAFVLLVNLANFHNFLFHPLCTRVYHLYTPFIQIFGV